MDVKHLIMAMAPKEKKKEDKKKKKKKKKDEEEDEEEGEELQEVVHTYHFPCSRWLAGGEEDGELVVELLPEDAEDLEGYHSFGFYIYQIVSSKCSDVAQLKFDLTQFLGQDKRLKRCW